MGKASKVENTYLFVKDNRNTWGCPCSAMVKVLDGGRVLSEFELQSRYYVHFRTNTHGKGKNHLIFPAKGYIASLLFFSKDSFGII